MYIEADSKRIHNKLVTGLPPGRETGQLGKVGGRRCSPSAFCTFWILNLVNVLSSQSKQSNLTTSISSSVASLTSYVFLLLHWSQSVIVLLVSFFYFLGHEITNSLRAGVSLSGSPLYSQECLVSGSKSIHICGTSESCTTGTWCGEHAIKSPGGADSVYTWTLHWLERNLRGFITV